MNVTNHFEMENSEWRTSTMDKKTLSIFAKDFIKRHPALAKAIYKELKREEDYELMLEEEVYDIYACCR